MALSRIRHLAYCLPLTLLIAAACEPGADDEAGGAGGGGDGGGPPSSADADGDGIADADEGDGDADGDGILNRDDEDADGDGIPDSVEAGDTDPDTPPVDSDNDGTPDFLDDDSDGNGILDADDGIDDFDDDGIPDFADSDDDGDTVQDAIEIAGAGSDCDDDGQPDAEGTPADPKDCDGDGSADYHDLDSDSDSIGDFDENGADTDGDGIRDRYDDDSDNDGFSDSQEAGDDDVGTDPVDTDDDDIPDFQDEDSDSDGVSDADEHEIGTDPTSVDTDGDGVSDLIEQVAGTDPTDDSDNPQANGDFVFIVPYEEPTTPEEDTVRFRTNIQFADVYFAFDTTGSMSAELTAMQNMVSGVPAIVNQLECANYGGVCNLDADCGAGVCFENHCIQDPNEGLGCIADVWTGVGRFDELNTYENLLSLQSDPAATAGAVPDIGGGQNEAPFQPSHCIANPGLCPNDAGMGCAGNGIGCPGFRADAIRIYVQITDANQQCMGIECTSFTAASAGAALQAAGIKFVGLWGTGDQTGTGTAQSVATDIANASGTVDSSGDPFVYQAIDNAVVQNTVTAIKQLAREKSLDTTIDATDADDGAGDTIDATQFIDYLEVNVSGSGECDVVDPTADTDGDGYDDAFPVLYPGKHVCWDVVPVPQNTTVPATDAPQIYRAILTVRGDGSPLDERDVYFLIPPKDVIITPPK
ncbi:MAG: hypothetical protein HOW73_38400 [Polyangiaceae bacterium]|nr:hypothetical protein [Polyangiaceae bacterium]